MHIAAQHGSFLIAKLLVENGVEINCQNIYQKSPLHLSLEKGQPGISELLINANANLEAKDGNGYTALHLAAKLHFS